MGEKIYWLFRTRVLLVLFLVFSAVLLAITHRIYSDRKNQQKQTIESNLKAVAELKASEINTWLNERVSDSGVLSHINLYPDFTIFSGEKNPGTLVRMKERLNILQTNYKYENIILLDLNGNIVLTATDSLTEITDKAKQALNQTLREKVMFRWEFSGKSHKILLDFYSAVLSPASEILGYLVLRTDPEKFLYPTLDRWPIFSKTAETVLLERTGDSIRPLKELKHLPGRLLIPTTPVSATNVPGVNAALGGPRLFEGLDYRSVPVLSYWVPIEGTEWKLIAKVDQEELYEPLQNQARAFGIILTILLLFLGALMFLIRNLYQKSYFKSLYDAEVERKLLVSHYDYLVKNANDIILLANAKGEIIEVNDAAVNTYRMKREDILGSPLHKLGDFGKTSKKDPSSKIYESVHYRADGTPFPVEINEQTITIEKTRYYQAIIREISERKAAEEKLRQSEALHRSIHASPDTIVISDLQGVIELVSPKITDMLGYRPDSMAGHSVYEFVSAEDQEKAKAVISGMFRGIFQVSNEYLAVKADGGFLDIEVTSEFIRDENGQPARIVMVVRDISLRRKTQHELDQSLAKYKALFYDSPDAYLIVRDGIFIECNKASERLIGGDRSAILGKTPPMISPEYQPNGKRSEDYVVEVVEEAMKTGSNSFEWVHTRVNGDNFLAMIHLSVISYEGYPSLFVTWRDITQLRESENQLRKLSRAVEQSPVSIVITNLEGEIEYANPKACLTTGYSLDELRGQNPRVLKSGETHMEEYQQLWDHISNGYQWRGTFHNKRKNGELYWESSTISPIVDPSGKITHYLAVKEDITERKQLQESLLVNEKRLSQVAEHSRTVIWEVDLNGLFTYVSPVAETVYGYRPDELVGKKYFYELHPEEYSREAVDQELGTIVKGIPVVDYDNTIRGKEGQIIWVSTNGTPLLNEKNEITGYRGADQDITARKLAEEELRKFLTISDSANYGNVISDLEGNLLYSNSCFARMHGYEIHEIIGKNLSMLHSEAQMPRVTETIERLKTHGEFHSEVIWRSRKDGTAFPSLMNAMLIFDKENRPVFMSATTIDITSQHEAEEFLRKSEESLNYAQEIANMGSWSLDMKSGEIKWSRNQFKLLGLDPAKNTETNDYFYRIVHPDDLRLLNEKQEEILKTRKATSVELRLVMPDGSVKWIQNNIVPEFEGDDLVALRGVNIDITEKKSRDAEINKLSQAVEQSPVLVVITDLNGDIIYVNHAFESTTGYSRQEVMGQNPRILNSGKLEPSFYKELWDTISAGKEWKGELINKKKNGELYWEQMSITPIHDSSGKVNNYLAIKQDISVSKATEQEILDLNASLEQKIAERTTQLTQTNEELAREIEERIAIEEALVVKSGELQSFFDVALDLLCIADTSGHFLKLNKAWENIMGYSVEELENKLFLDFVHPDDLQATLDVMRQLSEQNPVINFINRYKTRSGTYRFIEWRSAPSGQRIYAAARDITERKRKEDFELELLQLSAKLTGILPSEIREAIRLSLERIGRYTGSDRTFIFEIDPGGETFTNTYEWTVNQEYAQLNPEKNIPMSHFPMWWEELRQGRYINIPDVEELPDSWNSEKETILSYGDKSILAIPLYSENRLIGYSGLASGSERREFSIEEINLLSIWCSMLSSQISNFQTESLLELTRKNYETFFNTLDDFLWILDSEGTIIHFNNTAKSRLGYSLEELVGQSIVMIHPPDRREEARRQLDKLLTGSNLTFTIPLMTKSGQVIPVESRAIPGNWNGQPVLFKTSKDISLIKLSEQKFSSAFQSNSAMMAISDFENGQFLDVNNAFLEVHEFTREEVIGRTGRELKLFIDEQQRSEMTRDLNNGIPVRKMEVRMRTKSGEAKVGLMSADTIYLGDRKCLLTVNIDITERKKMEEQLKAAQEEANRANVAKSEFLSRMSHELRTPMNSILGFAQLLDMGELNPGQKKGIKHILNSGKHLLDLINEVLEISRIEAGRLSLSPEPIQISHIIHEMMEIVWPLAKERQLTLDLVASPVNQQYILADRQRLKQVLLNLINNAIKYNKEGGSIKITTELAAENESGCRQVRISIADTGIGIRPENISHLFNPFERIGAENTATEGTGLGLAVVKKLVDAMGGAVGVSSVPGEGSVFWIEFPLTDGQLDNLDYSGVSADQEDSLGAKKGTILYIEDNVSNIELVEQILFAHCENIRLISNMNGKEAVRMAREYNPDLILLDLNLPDIHGSEVLDLLRINEDTKSIPIVVISADATAQQLDRLKRKGADDYLTKPLDVKELLTMINKIIRN